MATMKMDDLLANYEHIWSNALNSYPGRPLRLVDISSIVNHGQLHFVPGAEDIVYCTISYTWITDKRDRDSKSFLERLSPFTVGGLISAVEVCHELGHKYLWIDALCIDQRRESTEKEREIPNMGKYYREASECIIFPDGLHLNADLLPDGKLPRWFYRSWTLQEYLLARKKTFVFNAAAQSVNDYVNVIGSVKGTKFNLKSGSCFCMDSDSLICLFRLITGEWTGDAPFKADPAQWKEIDRESAFMLEVDCSRKGDILQRAMFRKSKHDEDQIYALLSVFDQAKLTAQYGIGVEEVLRRLAEAVSNDELAYLLLTNWYRVDLLEASTDICALPTFDRQTAAVWFNMSKVEAQCKYVRSEGVHVASRMLKCRLSCKGPCTNSMYRSISIHSDMEMNELSLSTSCGTIEAYGRCLHDDGDVTLVVLGEFKRINSILTGMMFICRRQLCCLVCEEKENQKLRKIGLCICVFDEEVEDQLFEKSHVIVG